MNRGVISKFASISWLMMLASMAMAGDWPQWRGPERTGHVSEGEVVPGQLAASPKVEWKIEIGGGFSSPVVADGKLIYQDGREGKEWAHAVDAKSGREIWSVAYADIYQDEWGPGPRSTPIVDGERVYVQSCNGEFRCLNMADGKTIWGKSFDKDYGVKFLGSKAQEGTASRRGNNGCGVIDGERIFLPVGSTQGASIVCFDKRTGKELWRSGNDEAAYSSLLMADLAGMRQVVAFTAEALMGTQADDGKILWRVPLRTDSKRHAATPVIFGDTVMVNSHTIGLLCFKIARDGAGWKASQLWGNRELKINLASPVLVGNYLYSQGAGKNYVCVDALTGKQMWSAEGFGDKLSVTIAVGKNLLVQTDKGELVLVAANPAKYMELGRAQVCGKTWNSPAYADGKLFVREGLDRGWKLTCFDLIDKKPAP
jgi:outer membrane protein assembly factor BamB